MLEPLRAEFHVSMALISLRGDMVREGGRKGGLGAFSTPGHNVVSSVALGRAGGLSFIFGCCDSVYFNCPQNKPQKTPPHPASQPATQPFTHPAAPLAHLIFPLLSWIKKIAMIRLWPKHISHQPGPSLRQLFFYSSLAAFQGADKQLCVQETNCYCVCVSGENTNTKLYLRCVSLAEDHDELVCFINLS